MVEFRRHGCGGILPGTAGGSFASNGGSSRVTLPTTRLEQQYPGRQVHNMAQLPVPLKLADLLPQPA